MNAESQSKFSMKVGASWWITWKTSWYSGLVRSVGRWKNRTHGF